MSDDLDPASGSSRLDQPFDSPESRDESVDVDPQETREWVEALEAVLEREGPQRAHFLLEALASTARRLGAHLRSRGASSLPDG